jgi:hypothetical protein
MTTSIINYINAAYPLINIQGFEPDRAMQSIVKEAEDGHHKCYSWDISSGLTDLATGEGISIDPGPMSPLAWLSNAAPENTILFVHNFHKFLPSVEILQSLVNGRDVWKAFAKCLIILSPSGISLPTELEKSVQVIDFTLPNEEALEGILRSICTDASVDYPDEANTFIQQALGLTLYEAESAFALSLSSTGLTSFSSEIIIEQKSQIVKKNSSLELSHFSETFDQIGGLQNLKTFCSKTVKSKLARGVVLLGLSGCGKSMFAKALGNHAGLPVLSLDMGKLFGSLVGSSEQKTREALQVASAMAPAILFVEEGEKSLSNAGGGNDSGTSSRVFGAFLTWLNDHKEQVYTIITCNSIDNVPMEFLRSERFDGIFFVDLPTTEEADVILEMYKKHFNVTGPAPDISNWSGAEIRSLCRISAMMDIPLQEAAKYIIPLYKSHEEKIKKQREWAKGRCIPASSSALEKKSSKRKRSIASSKPEGGGGSFISSN